MFDISKLAKKVDLASLKLEVDKLDMDKLVELDVHKLNTVPIDLKKLSFVFDKKSC